MASQNLENPPANGDYRAIRINDDARALDDLSNRTKRRIVEMSRPQTSIVQRQVKFGERIFSSVPIVRFPHNLEGIDNISTQPELVTIGPYHRDKHQENHRPLEFEEHKWYFVRKFLSRAEKDSTLLIQQLGKLEKITRECYSDEIPMSCNDYDEFVEMMLLDGCFVVEVLYNIAEGGSIDDNPVLSRPWLIPILIRDLVKLDNQLPYFLLEFLYEFSWNPEHVKEYPLALLALKSFNHVSPRSFESLEKLKTRKGKHLLDLFYWTLVPPLVNDNQRNQTLDKPIQCVTQLRLSGLKFQSTKSDTFLDIKFQNTLLKIPSFVANDFTSTVLINCIALEQCLSLETKYFADFAVFMSCLVKEPRDVAFLRSDGIITTYSNNDKYVADLFNSLEQKVGAISSNSYLSNQARGVVSYHHSTFAVLRRKYCNDPLSSISYYALLILILTLVQTMMEILSYIHHHKDHIC